MALSGEITRRRDLIVEIVRRNPLIQRDEILKRLHNAGFFLSQRTLERDLEILRHESIVSVQYNYFYAGYELSGDTPENMSTYDRMKEFHSRGQLLELARRKEFAPFMDFEKPLEFPELSHFEIIARAIHKRYKIEIEYIRYGRNESKTHVVMPYLIKEYQQRWYLISRLEYRNDFVPFSLDKNRLLSVKLLSEKFKRNQDVEEVKKRFADVIGITLGVEENVETVIISLTPDQAGYLESQPWHISQKCILDSPEEKQYSFTLIPNVELEKKILSFIPAIRVVEPEWLREKILFILKQNLISYS